MDAKRTLSISEARKRIFEIADEVQKPDTHYTLTENGRPKAVIMSAEEFESLRETIEVLQEFPDLKKDTDEAERDFMRGDYVTLDEILAKEGYVKERYVIADKGRQRYDASRRRTKKGPARAGKNT